MCLLSSRPMRRQRLNHRIVECTSSLYMTTTQEFSLLKLTTIGRVEVYSRSLRKNVFGTSLVSLSSVEERHEVGNWPVETS